MQREHEHQHKIEEKDLDIEPKSIMDETAESEVRQTSSVVIDRSGGKQVVDSDLKEQRSKDEEQKSVPDEEEREAPSKKDGTGAKKYDDDVIVCRSSNCENPLAGTAEVEDETQFQNPEGQQKICEVFYEERKLGDVVTYEAADFKFPDRMNLKFSASSKHSPPLAIVRMISTSFTLLGKIKASSIAVQPELNKLYESCLIEFKTVFFEFGDTHIHLVALNTHGLRPCFNCYAVPGNRLYRAALWFLDSRYLGVVLSLDNVFVEWNNMESFNLKINQLQELCTGIPSAELDRYQEDRKALKQFIADGTVGSLALTFSVTLHSEMPAVRLPECENAFITCLDLKDPKTSILVRVTPSWTNFKTYLVGKNSRRFDVYACMEGDADILSTIWANILDVDARLVARKSLQYHLFGLKSGLAKSLDTIFPNGQSPPGMTIIVDGHNDGWRKEDRARVLEHVKFSAYKYSEQVASHVFSMDSALLCLKSARQEFFDCFDSLLVDSFNVLYEKDSTLHNIDVGMFLKPKIPDKDVIKGTKSTSIIVFNDEKPYERTAFIAALQYHFGKRISRLGNAHSKRELFRLLYSDSLPNLRLIIIHMDSRNTGGCMKLVEKLRKSLYIGDVVGITTDLKLWDDNTLSLFSSVYEEDGLDVNLVSLFQHYIPPELSLLVYLHEAKVHDRATLDFTQCNDTIFFKVATNRDELNELLGRNYDFVLMLIDIDSDRCKEIAKDLHAKFNCKLIGLTEKEPSTITDHIREDFVRIYFLEHHVHDDGLKLMLEKVSKSEHALVAGEGRL